jgi:hypothetical protein
MTDKQKRYVGLDVHKHYVMVGAVNRSQEMVLPPRKISLVEFEGWARKHLGSTDEVVLEATTNAWYLYDLLEPLVERVVVCHPRVWLYSCSVQCPSVTRITGAV